MKFRASLTDRALRELEQTWLPALERHAKAGHLLLTPDGMHILLSPRDAGGVHVCARWAARAAFAPATLRVAARHGDAIALRVDLAALRRGLRGAAALSPESVDVRLTTTTAPGAPSSAPTPTLRLVATGGDAGLTHDLPLLARPLPPADLDALIADRDAAPLAPWYVDAAPRAARLAAAADRLAALAPAALVVELCPAGALRLRASGGGAALAVEAAGLDVLPPTARAAPDAGPPPSLAEDAPPPPGAVRVAVAAKDVSRALAVAASTRAARALVGVTAGGAALHFVLAYPDASGAGVDADTDLTVRVPVLVEDEV